MAKFSWILAAVVAVAWGCGGSAGQSGGSGAGGDVTFGNLSTRAFVNSQPVTINSTQSSSIGLVGAISEVNYRDLSNSLEETYIAYTRGFGSIFVSAPNGDDEFDQLTKTHFDSVAQTRWHPDGKRLFVVASPLDSTAFNLYSIIPFAPGTPTLIEPGVVSADLNPTGTRIAYVKPVNGVNQVFVASINGSGDTQLTNLGNNAAEVAWPREEFVIYSIGTAVQSISTNGSGQAFGALSSSFPFSRLDASPDGRWWVARFNTNIVAVPISESGSFGFSADFGTAPSSVFGVAIAPDSETIITGNDANVYQTDVRAQGQFAIRVTTNEEPPLQAVSWQPFGASTLMVGNGGRYGSAASGVIYTQRSSNSGQFGSMVLFTAQTPSTARMSAEVSAPNSPYLTFVAEMDKISRLSFTTGRTLILSSVIGSPGNANGAIVSINSLTGRVASVVPYAISRSGKPKVTVTDSGVKVEGDLLGVFDGTGTDIAEGGASTVELGPNGLQVR